MTTQRLDKQFWQEFFDRATRGLNGRQAEIEVASPAIGDQVQARTPSLIGISYDPHDQIVDVAMEGLDHIISRPREIAVELKINTLSRVDITDGEGNHHIIKLKDPLMLPPPRAM